jgi:hypothetical protein
LIPVSCLSLADISLIGMLVAPAMWLRAESSAPHRRFCKKGDNQCAESEAE